MKKRIKGQQLWLCLKQLYMGLAGFLKGTFLRLFLLYRLMSRREKLILAFLLATLFVTLTIKARAYYCQLTTEVPAEGGIYSEALFGQPKYINPILAVSKGDKTLCNLIYAGLLSLNNQNQATLELAESYQISEDKKSYTFRLKPNLVWHDNKPFSAEDVAYTIYTIKDPAQKSPLYSNFKDVEVEIVDNLTIKFNLANSYGPFLTSLNFGIIPAGKTLAELNTKPIGLGAYHYISSQTKSSKVEKIILERFDQYFGKQPYLQRVEFGYYGSYEDAKSLYEQEEYGAFPYNFNRVNADLKSYDTSAKIFLLFNLRQEPFSNKDLRLALKNNQKLENEQLFKITVIDNPELVAAADQFKERVAEYNFKVEVVVLKENDYKEKINQRDYQALIIGIDFGHDFDPYPLWHSSQIESGMNLAGFTSKESDIILEDARLINDPAARQEKYAQFNQIVENEALQIKLSEKKFYLSIDKKYKNVILDGALTAAEHLKNINNWYIKTKRVRK
jgi:ABC-type transport system substrate-binding protein